MVSFIILHYKNLKDTLECIESIKKQKRKDYSIIIVDNGSLSDKEKLILEKESKDIIYNEENLGFATANNIGATYAIKKYKPDFLVVLNNDIVLMEDDFIDKIYDCYEKISFDFMGPKIITENGESVNPFPAYQTLEMVEEAIQKSKKLIRIYQSTLLTFLLHIYIKMKRLFVPQRHLENGKNSQSDVAVHGCCIIFSKKYYQKYNTVFYPGTFLYHEEEFLEYRRTKDHLITYYDSFINVFHKEGASLNTIFEKNREKLIFRNQEIIKSLKLLKELMLQENGSVKK